MNMEYLQKAGCQFVLNEGIMPSAIVRLLKNSTTNGSIRENDLLLVASILQDNRNFCSEKHADIASIAKSVFDADVPLTDWLGKTHNILDVILNNIKEEDSFFNAEDIIRGALICFIKSCPFVGEEKKQEYISKLERKNDFNLMSYGKRAIKQPEIKKSFEEYLYLHGYQPSTVNSYKSAINVIGDFCSQEGIVISEGASLWEVQNLREFEKIKRQLENNGKFLEKNAAGNSILFNGFKRFGEFLEENKS